MSIFTVKVPLSFMVVLFTAWAFNQLIVSDIEIVRRVIIADALHDLFQRRLVVGIFAVFDPLADDIAEDPPEINSFLNIPLC